jgi:hypothetical protein
MTKDFCLFEFCMFVSKQRAREAIRLHHSRWGCIGITIGLQAGTTP